MFLSRSVDNTPYHIWTDALHGRALARQARNEWDRGTYVRWTIISAWTALEIACADALRAGRIGERFKERMDAALHANGFQLIDWSRGTWQKVLEIQQWRHDYTHRFVPQANLFPPVSRASEVIATVRDAIRDLYGRVSKSYPTWVDDDEAQGWSGDGSFSSTAHAMVRRAGANEDDSEVIRVAYVYQGHEYVSEVLPPGADPDPVVAKLLQEIRIPISAVRVYRGHKLQDERKVRMRGS
jgi:hypothetical protein